MEDKTENGLSLIEALHSLGSRLLKGSHYLPGRRVVASFLSDGLNFLFLKIFALFWNELKIYHSLPRLARSKTNLSKSTNVGVLHIQCWEG